MKVPRFQHTRGERKALKRLAERVFSAILGETDEFRQQINVWENNYVSLQLAQRIFKYVLGFIAASAFTIAGLVAAGLVASDDVVLWGAGGFAVSFVAGILLSISRRTAQDEAYQRSASLFVSTKKLENYRLFPFKFRPNKPKRDARRNLSGQMVGAVERRIQLQPRLIHEKAEEWAYPVDPEASNLAAELALTTSVQNAVTALGPETPAVRIDKFFERQLMVNYARQRLQLLTDTERRSNYFLRSRGARNAIKAGLALRAVGSIMRDERRASPRWRRTFRTNPYEQVCVLKENEDVRLRYRTASPHLNWPDPDDQHGDFETAQHLVLHCVQNPMSIPVYFISVQDILGRIDDAIEVNRTQQGADLRDLTGEIVLERLLTSPPTMFSRWNTAAMVHRDQTPNSQPILKNLSEDPEAPDYGIRWDVNRIEWNSLDDNDEELRFAFATLIKAIELAGDEAEPCVLTRGDAVLIDNHRCLVARREFLGSNRFGRLKYGLGVDPVWDMKAYSGFRPTPILMSAGGS